MHQRNQILFLKLNNILKQINFSRVLEKFITFIYAFNIIHHLIEVNGIATCHAKQVNTCNGNVLALLPFSFAIASKQLLMLVHGRLDAPSHEIHGKKRTFL